MDIQLHQIHQGVVDYAREASWILDARTHQHRDLLHDAGDDGILTFSSSHDLLGPVVRSLGLPIVNMSRWQPELGLPTVLMDDYAVGVLAAEHLLSRGFQQLTMVRFFPASPSSSERYKGFATTVAKAGRQLHVIACEYGMTVVQQIAWARKQLLQLPRPLGVFTEGDTWAVELMNICWEEGVAVPDQVAIMGVDNDPMLVDVSPVPLTSVDNNLRGLGYAAAQLLDQILSGAPAPTEPILISPIGVVQRQSTNAMAVDDEDIVLAVRFIENHFAQALTIDQVAEQTHLSARRLQDRFNLHLGRTIADEIQRCRLEHATRLLRDSDLKLETVAARSGFGNAVQMTKVFTRELQTSPAKYRKGHRTR